MRVYPAQCTRYDWYAVEGINVNYAPLQRQWARRILRHYRMATSDQIQQGIDWYPNARKALEPYCDVWSPSIACGVCAVLSPRVTWKDCLRYTGKMHGSISQGLRVPPVCGGVRRNVNRAWYIAESGDTSVISGPKVRSFYANLSGDFTAVTCDEWIARAVGTKLNMGHDNRYRAIADTFRNVATRLSLAPAALQAIVWIVVRGNHE